MLFDDCAFLVNLRKIFFLIKYVKIKEVPTIACAQLAFRLID